MTGRREDNISVVTKITISPGGCKSRVVGCGPDCWTSPHTVCSAGRCSCLPGYQAEPVSHTASLVCSPASSNSTLQADQAAKPVNDINIHYYPGNVFIQTKLPKENLQNQCCNVTFFQKLVFSTTGCLQ